jgi:deazaflavin-dependent oxidoreductase (nitroreductase family)
MSSDSPPALEGRQRRRRARHRIFWRIVNPPSRPFAGYAPWWVLLETKGRRTGIPRTTPLARGPVDGNVVWLNAVHGRHAQWVRNLEATPEVRIKLSGRWRDARATVHPYEPSIVRRFNPYARSGPKTLGIDPALVRVEIRG